MQNPVSLTLTLTLTRQLKLFINVFTDIGKSIDIAAINYTRHLRLLYEF